MKKDLRKAVDCLDKLAQQQYDIVNLQEYLLDRESEIDFDFMWRPGVFNRLEYDHWVAHKLRSSKIAADIIDAQDYDEIGFIATVSPWYSILECGFSERNGFSNLTIDHNLIN